MTAFDPRSFRGKLILLSFGSTLVSSLLVVAMNYQHVSNGFRDAAVERLAADVRVLAARIDDVFDDLQRDAVVLSEMPATGGVMRSSRTADGVDPEDGSTKIQWRWRLEAIFMNMLRQRQYYTQLRYIGVADEGREIVRVDQQDGKLMRVPAAQLQQKAREPYFKQSLDLRPGESMLSKVTYNREHSGVDPENLPTIRQVVPVFDADQALFGLIVINADYRRLLQKAMTFPERDHVVTILNGNGDYLQSSADTEQPSFHYHEEPGWEEPPLLRTLLSSNEKEAALFENDEVTYFVRLMPGATRAWSTTLGIVAALPMPMVMAEAGAALRQNLMLVVFLVLLTAIIAVHLGYGLTRPLVRLTETIKSGVGSAKPLNLPTEARDEIGDLARAFQALSDDLFASHREVRRSEGRLNDIVSMAPIGIMSVDRRGRITSINKMAQAMFGYEEAELFERPVHILLPERFRAKHDVDLEAFIKEDAGAPRRMALGRQSIGLRKDGTELELEIGLSKVTMLDGSFEVATTLLDITERREAEERKRHAIILEHRNQELEQFATIASHDLKEPLRAIGNHAKFLIEDFGDTIAGDGAIRLNRMAALTKRMEQLISDLLFFSRLRHGGQAMASVDLHVIIADIESNLAESLQSRNARIVVRGSLPPVEGYPPHLMALFQNLNSNGSKYNDADERIIEIGLAASSDAADRGGFNTYYAKDNGIGIPEQSAEDVFRIFKRLNSDKAYGAGTGAGLSFVKKIVENLGGSIWFTSKMGQGTTFFFTLPKAITAVAAHINADSSQAA